MKRNVKIEQTSVDTDVEHNKSREDVISKSNNVQLARVHTKKKKRREHNIPTFYTFTTERLAPETPCTCPLKLANKDSCSCPSTLAPEVYFSKKQEPCYEQERKSSHHNKPSRIENVPSLQTETPIKNKRAQSKNYIPVWYQQAHPDSSNWFDGAAYYNNIHDPTNQIGAFAPNVNVEKMVKLEKKRRGIKETKPYSDEDMPKNKKKNKKDKEARKAEEERIISSSNNVEPAQVHAKRDSRSNVVVLSMDSFTPQKSTREIFDYDQYAPSSAAEQDIPSTEYTMFKKKTSRLKVKRSSEDKHDRKRETKSAPAFGTIAQVHTALRYEDNVNPFTQKRAAETQSTLYTISSVSSGEATEADLPFNYFNQPCSCVIKDCKCKFTPCSAKNQPPPQLHTGRELGSLDRCLNQSMMSACSRGRSDSQSKGLSTEAGASHVGDREGENNADDRPLREYDRVFVRRRSSAGDFNHSCNCTTEDCYCIFDPCASRERRKRKFKKKKKKKRAKIYKPKKPWTINDDKGLLCQIAAIEKPFSWCMRTCCVTWIWHDREFIRHCGRVLGDLPDYTQKPPSLHESALRRCWDKRYQYDDANVDETDDDDDKVVQIMSNTK